MVVIPLLGEVDHTGAVAQVHVVEKTERLQHVQGAVHGGLVDGAAPGGVGAPLDVAGGEVLLVGLGQHLADGTPGGGDAQPLPAQRADQIFGGDVHPKDGTGMAS